IGGIAASLPFGAHAQERVRRVGVLSNPGPDDAEMQTRIATFVQGLQQLGWIIGRTLQIDYRWSHGDADRLRTHTAELVALGPDVVLAVSGVSILPFVQASRSVPIVFAQTIDPVSSAPANVHRNLILRLAAQHRLPTVYPFRYFVAAGELL